MSPDMFLALGIKLALQAVKTAACSNILNHVRQIGFLTSEEL